MNYSALCGCHIISGFFPGSQDALESFLTRLNFAGKVFVPILLFSSAGLVVFWQSRPMAETPVGVIPLGGFAAASLAEDTFMELPGCTMRCFLLKACFK